MGLILKRRIVHIIDSLGVGGAQTVIFELHLAFEKYHPEYEQTIILAIPNKVSDKFVRSYGIHYETSKSTGHLQRRILGFKEPVTVIYHKLMCSSMTSMRGLLRKVPIICINHTRSESMSHNKIRYCNVTVSVSSDMRRLLTSKFHISGRHATIFNGVNLERFDNIEIDKPERPDTLVTGRTNALNTIKYSDGWIKWCLSVGLPKKMEHRYIGGGGPLKQARKLADNPKSRNDVVMLGGIPKLKDKIREIKKWDLFLYEINRNEGVSMSVLEALASGVPVICSNHFGNKEIIADGVNGYVFKSRDHAKAILTDLCNDPARLEKLRKTTREHFIEKLDAKVMASQYAKLIESVSQKDFKKSANVSYRVEPPEQSIVKSRGRTITKGSAATRQQDERKKRQKRKHRRR